MESSVVGLMASGDPGDTEHITAIHSKQVSEIVKLLLLTLSAAAGH